ncbi:Uncharacterized protein HZ326_20627 [Fusarium oxysporum f. sp. albedinis]|nr:Uncharacterized protein HZ326_20627 [Fusarium oxysporum f. sp. albedinis]
MNAERRQTDVVGKSSPGSIWIQRQYHSLYQAYPNTHICLDERALLRDSCPAACQVARKRTAAYIELHVRLAAEGIYGLQGCKDFLSDLKMEIQLSAL